MTFPKYLTIIGNVASGKSTAMPILLDALDAQPLYADDLFQTVDPFREVYLNDLKRWAFTNELWLTYERAKMINEHGSDSEKLVIVDSGLLMSWVYTYSHLLVKNISLEEWEFYEKLYDEFANGYIVNSCVIRLKYSMETLMQRLKKRGRDYELEFYTREYLEQLEDGLVALEKKLKQMGIRVLVIDEKQIRDFEKNDDDKNLLTKIVTEYIHAQEKLV